GYLGSLGGGAGEPGFAEYVLVEDAGIYGAGGAFPRETVWLADKGTLRHQQVVKVMAAPFVYRPAESRVDVTGRFRITVRFAGGGERGGIGGGLLGEGSGLPGAARADAWEGVYQDAVLNYEQGKRWRVSAKPMVLSAKGAAGTGLRAAPVVNQRVKIAVDTLATGFYSLSFDTLAGMGFPGGVPVDEVFIYRDIFRDGSPDTLEVVESAIRVLDRDSDNTLSGGDAVEFFAQDHYDQFGRRGNEDAFYNKNVYWLSWGEGQHRRMTSRPGWREADSPERPLHFPDFVHVERDSYFMFFPPLDDMDLFVWTRLRRITPFDLPGIDTAYATSLTVRFVNYYNYYEFGFPRTPIIALYMTGCAGVQTLVDSMQVSYMPSVTTSTLAMPPGLLCEERNQFRFEAPVLDPGAVPGNMLDWFEVAYQRKYKAEEDLLVFTEGGASGEVEYEVTGFTCGAIRLFDVTDPTAPAEIDLGVDQVVADGGGFKMVFRDSVDGARKYLALCPERTREVASAQAALRSAPSTRDALADYLIVSHPDFASELDRIVARRELQGLSVLLATSEEIYDDFGNGMKSDTAIKRFIRQSFFAGDAQFVLLVGDANTDHRGILLTLPPRDNQPRSDIDWLPTHTIVRKEEEANKEIRPAENWFVTVGGAGDVYPDLYLGRFPVGTPTETRTIVDKIARFEDDTGADPWKKRVVVAADDEYKFAATTPASLCYYAETDFMTACDRVAAIAKDSSQVAVDTVKYYLRRCVAADQPDKRCDRYRECCTHTETTRTFTRANCTPQLVSAMNAGALLVNYQGHANRDRFAHESWILDGGNELRPDMYTDIRGLTNSQRPFMFAGYGCWISEFQRRSEPMGGVQDAIGEKFLTAPNGGACAVFASGCSESIINNRNANPYLASAMFSRLVGVDPQGNPIPARILAGEVVMASLVRFGIGDYAARYIYFGDPAMVVDMGAPAVAVAVNDSVIDGSYVFRGETFDTVTVVSEIKDEEAIMEIAVDIIQGADTTDVPQEELVSERLVDFDNTRSRAYRTTYRHVPLLGDYTVRVSGTDYSGKQGAFGFRVATGSAAFSKDAAELAEGDNFFYGQTLKAALTRPVAFAAEDITAWVDTVPAGEYPGYSVAPVEGKEGKEWTVSLRPALTEGVHTFKVSAQGFVAERSFEFVPVSVELWVGGRSFFEDDFVARDAVLVIRVLAEPGLGDDQIEVGLDGSPQPVEFQPDSSGAGWIGGLALGPIALEAGRHRLTVTVLEVTREWNLRTSDQLDLLDVSVFPNPFSGITYFYYTLSEPADRASLTIYTVAGRKVFAADLTTFAGYNQFSWDGRDFVRDRLANGTYVYRVVVEAAGSEREFTGRLVKLD
ncbi:MAG: C25 family cysteine peptidase, partial [bacterium]